MGADGSAVADVESPKTTRLHTFISYAHADRNAALERKRELEGAGHAVFLDAHSLRSGELWPDTLRENILTANGFWLIWSRHAAQSKWVKNEYMLALAISKQYDLGRFIQIQPLDATKLPRRLAKIQTDGPYGENASVKPSLFVVAALVLAAAAAIAALPRHGKTSVVNPTASTASAVSASTATTVPSAAPMKIVEPPQSSGALSNILEVPTPHRVATQTSTGLQSHHPNSTPSASPHGPAAPSTSVPPSTVSSNAPAQTSSDSDNCKKQSVRCALDNGGKQDKIDECMHNHGCTSGIP